MKKIITIAIAILGISLTACVPGKNFYNDADTPTVRETIAESNHIKKIGEAQKSQTKRIIDNGVIEISFKKVEKATPETKWLEDKVSYKTSQTIDISSLGSELSKITGKNVIVEPDVIEEYAGSKISTNYTGDIKGLLEEVCLKANLFWTVKDDTVFIKSTDTQIFQISSFDSKWKMKNSIKGLGKGDLLSSSLSGEYWDEVKTTIEQAISSKGSVAVSPSIGYITVTDTRAKLREVAKIIKKLNKELSQQVLIEFKIISVIKSANDSFSVDIKEALSKTFNHSITTNTSSGVTGAVVSATVGNGAFSLTSAIDALKTIGEATLSTSGNAVTLNNNPVPIDLSRKIRYVESRSSTITPVTGAIETQINTKELDFGTKISALPRIIGNKVLLRLDIGISTLDKLENLVVDSKTGDFVQIPETSERNLVQNFKVDSGESLVLIGFEQEIQQNNEQGPISPKLIALGGSKNNSLRKESLVIVITPTILTN